MVTSHLMLLGFQNKISITNVHYAVCHYAFVTMFVVFSMDFLMLLNI